MILIIAVAATATALIDAIGVARPWPSAGAVTTPERPSVAAPLVVAPRDAVRHATTPCARNRLAQVVVVSIAKQHAWACSGHQTVISTPVTTGADHDGDDTPRGSFEVQGLIRNTTLTTSGGSSYPVRYWIPFHLGVWGFHDAAWQKIPFGSRHYLTRGSHGCVHVPLPAMRQLFDWVHYGTVVRVR